eukprot:jgi/Picre1/28610/NNA_004010.t1
MRHSFRKYDAINKEMHKNGSVVKRIGKEGSIVGAAASVFAADVAKEEEGGMVENIKLGLLFASWYLANIYFNIFNKQMLKVFPYPVTCTAIHFMVGSILALTMWLLRIHQRPKLESETLKSISPLAGIHVLGNVLTNMSLKAVAVSFTHTIKALEPFFSVLLSFIFLGSIPTIPVAASLLPIVAGVALASISELSFNWTGFLTALGSNVTFQSRNVLSKKLMLKGKDGLDNINLFNIMTIMSFLILAPITILVEGVQVTPAVIQSLPEGMVTKAIIASVAFHSYQQISYLVLQRVSPVTHSIGNCIKRVVVIVASVIAFNIPVSRQNALGTALALFGVFLYSQAKRAENAKEKAT